MEQLKKAYEALEMLRALDLPVSSEQLKAIKDMEQEYLQNEIIPLLKQEMDPMVERLQSKFQLEVVFEPGNGLNMSIMEQPQRKIVENKAIVSTARDIRKYSIDGGEPLKKRRLVLEVVRKYVHDNPYISYEELNRRFPEDLSGSLMHGVVRPYESVRARLANQPDLEKRFFLSPEDIIQLANGMQVTVFNQWNQESIDRFLVVARKLYDIEEV